MGIIEKINTIRNTTMKKPTIYCSIVIPLFSNLLKFTCKNILNISLGDTTVHEFDRPFLSHSSGYFLFTKIVKSCDDTPTDKKSTMYTVGKILSNLNSSCTKHS